MQTGVGNGYAQGVAALPERLVEHADATLDEQCARWRGVSELSVSMAMMSRALTRIGHPRKTSR